MKRKVQVAVALGVLTKDRKVLLTLRNQPGESALHEKWEIPGGCIEFGETAEEAVRREIMEETGYEVEVIRLIPFVYTKIWEHEDHDTHVILLSFLCRPIQKLQPVTNEEILDLQWFLPEQLHKLEALPGLREIIDAAGL